MRGWPFSSKKTRMKPSSSVSPIACVRTTSVLPRSSSIGISSPTGEAVEIDRRRQDGDRSVGLGGADEVGEHLRVHEIGGELAGRSARSRPSPQRPCAPPRDRPAGCSEPGRTVIGVSPFSTFFCSAVGHPPGGWPRSPRIICTTDSGKATSFSGSATSRGGEPRGDHHQREVADHLRRRRHLDDVAEQPVDVGIGLGHLVPARLEAERARLFLEIGELAARHLVQIDLRGAEAEIGLEGAVLRPHRLEIERDLADRRPASRPVSRSVSLERLDERAEAGLRGQAGHGIDRRIDGVDARLDRGQHRGGRNARRVVGVEVDRQPDLLAERRHQLPRRRRLEQPGHVLDADDVGAGASPVPSPGRHSSGGCTWLGQDRGCRRCSRSPPRRACRPRAPRPSRRACSRPSSGSRRRGRDRCRPSAASRTKKRTTLSG